MMSREMVAWVLVMPRSCKRESSCSCVSIFSWEIISRIDVYKRQVSPCASPVRAILIAFVGHWSLSLIHIYRREQFLLIGPLQRGGGIF